MSQPSPLLTFSDTILWLKAILTAATLALLYLRHKRAKAAGASATGYSLRTKALVGLALLFSFGVFHNLGSFRGGSFVHHGEMFHYYLGSKYFAELGYYGLYEATIAADTEQGNTLAGMPFYTDLRTYQNAQRDAVLGEVGKIKALFSSDRWNAFKEDVAFFRQATTTSGSQGLFFLLMDHGYNASPVSTFVLGAITNAVPVTQLPLLALLDVVLVAAMVLLVFRTFGFELGALFAVYFFVNILNDREYISGSLLRYDWLLYVIAAVCLLERGRHAWSAFFLTLAAMLRIFPAVLFLGIAVVIVREWRTTGKVDRKYVRFVLTAGATALALFVLPATSLGTVLQPWNDFAAKTRLHDDGVYVNHLGLRGIVLFEPSHLSLERFVGTYKHAYRDDIVRNWQDVKEKEYQRKKPLIVLASLLVLAAVAAIIWKGRERDAESILWPVLLIYTSSFPSHYYYAFLCLFVLLFFRRADSLAGFVPIASLLILNLALLVTDSFGPSPIVFYTLANIYLFVCLSSILGFELYRSVSAGGRAAPVAGAEPAREATSKQKQRQRHARQNR